MSAIKEALENRIELLEYALDINKQKFEETGEEHCLERQEANLKDLADLKLALGQEIARIKQKS